MKPDSIGGLIPGERSGAIGNSDPGAEHLHLGRVPWILQRRRSVGMYCSQWIGRLTRILFAVAPLASLLACHVGLTTHLWHRTIEARGIPGSALAAWMAVTVVLTLYVIHYAATPIDE